MITLFRYLFCVPWYCRYKITFAMIQTSVESYCQDWQLHDNYVERFVEWGTMRCRLATFCDFCKYRKFLKQYRKVQFIIAQERRQLELSDVIYKDYSTAHSSGPVNLV